ncbi:MAG: 4Fe-4S dicluster domain-containing protein [Dehalococcoidia bacterium]|jgi:formate dehydrogenase iron-sulfur subunit
MISRRNFLKASAGAAGLLFLHNPSLAMASESGQNDRLSMLIDITKCVGCWWCYAACKEYNNLPETELPDLEEPPELSPTVWTTLKPVKSGTQWISRKNACNHCTDAACVEVCPTGALSYNDSGYVQYEKSKCSGCGYCAEVCPFEVPQLETNSVTGVAIMNKCTFCHDRVSNGESPACAAACPTGAITFGKRSELISSAEARLDELKGSNSTAQLYGVEELGGLNVMYILDNSPETYGLPADPEVPASVTVRKVFSWIGPVAAIAVVAGFGLNYIVARMRMANGEK